MELDEIKKAIKAIIDNWRGTQEDFDKTNDLYIKIKSMNLSDEQIEDLEDNACYTTFCNIQHDCNGYG